MLRRFCPLFNRFPSYYQCLEIECIWMLNIFFLNKTSLGLISIGERLDRNIGKRNIKTDICINSDINNKEFTIKFVNHVIQRLVNSLLMMKKKSKIIFQMFNVLFHFGNNLFNFLYVSLIRFKIMFSYLGSRDWLP